MIDEKIKVDLVKSFTEKKYKRVINIIEDEIHADDLSSQILNILGAAKLLDSDKNDINIILDCFKKAYDKEKTTKQALEALINFIQLTITHNKAKLSLPLIEEALNHFKYEKKLMFQIFRVYLKLNNVEKAIFFLKTLIKNNDADKEIICTYMYLNLMENNWTQEDYFKFSKNLPKILIDHKKDNFVELTKTKQKPIKIGFLSADIIKKHSVTYFLRSILINKDDEQFETIFISNIDPKKEDDTTREFEILFDDRIDIFSKNDLDATNILRAKKIDIVIDLMSITSDNRIELLKNRVAPIQISWMGFCNTSGIKEIDYILSDKNLILENEVNLYSEKVIYLNKIWNCHSGINSKRFKVDPPSLKNGFITFGSFNNFLKLSNKNIEIWAEILKKVKNSKLILKSSRHKEVEIIQNKFESYGIKNQIIFESIRNFDDHLKLYDEIDIALDTFPYTGVTTTFEAIWKGVPVLTLNGNNFTSRCGKSINKNLGTDWLVATNYKDYVEKACFLSTDKNKLLELRNFIFENSLKSPLFDVNSFRENFYQTLLNIYNKI